MIKNEKKNTQECNGCTEIRVCFEHASINFEDLICPCKTCLVKTMCTTKCEEYNKHYDLYRDILFKYKCENKMGGLNVMS